MAKRKTAKKTKKKAVKTKVKKAKKVRVPIAQKREIINNYARGLHESKVCFADHDDMLNDLKRKARALKREVMEQEKRLTTAHEVQVRQIKEAIGKENRRLANDLGATSKSLKEMATERTKLKTDLDEMQKKFVATTDMAKKELLREGKCFDSTHWGIRTQTQAQLRVDELFAFAAELLQRAPNEVSADMKITVFFPDMYSRILEQALATKARILGKSEGIGLKNT